MSNADKGYLLPDNPIVDEELSCTIVWYPDRDEYRRALLGSLHYLATWLAWERDSAHGGTIAAQAWKQANDLTMECWQMSCLEQLQSDVSAIRSLIANANYCCPDNLVIISPPGPTTTIDPGVGDPPDYYGETAITTWDEWEDYVCYNANAYVDLLKEQSEQIQDIVEAGAIGIGVIAAILGLLSGAGIILSIAYGTAAGIVGGIIQAGTTAIFADVPTLLEGARPYIIRAIMCGSVTLADAIEDAIGETLAWTLFYQYLDWNGATAIIRNGGHDGEYLPAETDDTCNCDWIYDVSYDEDFASNGGGFWRSNGTTGWWSPLTSVYFRDGYTYLEIGASQTYTDVPLVVGHTYRFVGMKYTLMHAVAVSHANTYKIYLASDNNINGELYQTRYTEEGGLSPAYNQVIIEINDWPDFTVTGGTQRLMQFQDYDGIDCFLGELQFYLLDVTP